MFKFPIVDLVIILAGVFLAWGFAWKAHWHFEHEMYGKAIRYLMLAVAMLTIAVCECIFTTPYAP
jgi:hypothetical protein